MQTPCSPYLFLVFAFAAALPAFAAEPPVARKVDVVDRDFGLSMPDPYRWMEGEGNAEFDAWLHAQGAASRAKLDALPTLQAWRGRLGKAASTGTSHFYHALVGGRLFFLRAEAGKEGVLISRAADGRERVLFDPNAEGKGGSISGFSVSPDAGKVAVNVGYGGNEIGEIALFDVATGRRIADAPKPVWSEFKAAWLPDSSGFFYTRMRDAKPGDPDPLQGMAAYLHKLGQPQSADRLIAQAGADDALKIVAHDFPIVLVTPGSEWAELIISGARVSARYCFAPLADAVAARATWRCIVDDTDNVQAVALHGDTAYLLSAKDAPNRRVLALDLRDPDADVVRARLVVPERADTVLTEVGAARDGLYLKSMRRGLDRIERVDHAGGAPRPVELPGEGTVYLMRTDPSEDGALLSLEGWTAPRKVYRYDGRELADTGLGALGVPAYPDLVAEEIEAVSADGTKVPLSVIRRRDLTLDGRARVVVEGYGGYGISVQPFFSPVDLEWPQAGNVLAVCHVRGGGENGDAWRIGGTGPNKQRGIEDFIACARELAQRGYSVPARTGGFSGSMGGILTGGAYVTAPQAWGAMAVQSGTFNPVRLLAEKNGANQIAEMGDPRTEAGMKQLLAMDPYQRVRDGVRYPPLLLVTGAVDQRVAPWNSGKFGARVAAASPGTPVWFRTDDQFGHFATNANAAALEFADIYAFLDVMLDASAAAAQAAAPASIDEVELIPREALFGNPERTNVQLSPDGKYLSWIAPVDGVLNVWVAPAGDPARAKAVTFDKARGIRDYFWSYRLDTLLYLRDTGGDEDFHAYAVDLRSGASKDLSPFPKTRAQVVAVSHLQPDSVLIGMNDRDPQWHDLYRVDLATGKRTLLQKNDAQIAYYIADANYEVRYATRSRPDGGTDVLKSEGKDGWEKFDDIPFDDALGTWPAGLTTDGSILYFVDSRNRNTSALYAVDTASGERSLVLEDARVDIGDTISDPATGKVQAVSVDYLREEWKPVDPSIAADLEKLKAIGSGSFGVKSRTLDDKTWIVAHFAAETAAVFYRYDRGDGGKLTRLFSQRPALDGKPLAPMWPQEIKSRDGLTLVGYLTLPKHADPNADGKPDKAVPMVLFVHGGPWARDYYGYSGWPQWLANRGYAVLQVNYRGSTGFGKEFTNAGNGEWAGKMHDDLIDAVKWAVNAGVTSADQVAIMGGSYGGYATLTGLTFTPDAFKCGVDIVGPSNLNTLLSTVPPYWASFFEQIAKRMGDPRTEEGRKWLVERSPLTRADQIRKPLLIGQGANDPRVKQAESDQIVKAMQAKNIPVTYALFPDEGHGFARPENSKAFNAVAEGFLAQCLGGRAEPIGADFKGSSIGVPTGADGVPGLAEALKTHTPEVKK